MLEMMTVSCGIGINNTDPKKETVLIPTDNPYIMTARRSHRDLGINVLYGSCVSLTLHMQIIIIIKVFIRNSMDISYLPKILIMSKLPRFISAHRRYSVVSKIANFVIL